MARRATKRGEDRTDLSGQRDLLICGASFAGLMIARQMAGSGADVLVIDRYEIGERQTSACVIPTSWLEELGLLESEKQRFDSVLIHTAHGSLRLPVPWSFSTFDYRTLCDLLWKDCDASFETAKVNGRAELPAEQQAAPSGNGNGNRVRNGNGRVPGGAARHLGEPVAIETDRGIIRAPLVVDAMGWKRVLAADATVQPPDAPLSRGLEVHPKGRNENLEVWIDRKYVPAGYGWSFPAGDELRIGVGSFDPRFHVRDTTELLAEDAGAEATGWQGNWIPHKLRDGTDEGIFFAGDSAGHCLPLTAEGIRPALYFGAALGLELRAVVDGRRTREQALASYHRFNASHERQFRWLLNSQKMLPKVPPRLVKPLLASSFAGPSGVFAFNRYLGIAPPEFARASAVSGAPAHRVALA
jgi:flavin-dependent dehydrogenase